MEKKKLFEEFPPVTTQQWEEVIQKDLKGADYEKKLIWKTPEGIKVSPYYRNEHLEGKKFLETLPGEYPFTRGVSLTNDWEIRQDIIIDNLEEANSKALDALSKGANTIAFSLKNICPENQNEFSALLKGINIEKTAVHFISNSHSEKIINFLIEEIKLHKLDKSKVRGTVTYDPIGNLCHKGNFYSDLKSDIQKIKIIIELVKKELPKVKTIAISGNIFHNSGASSIQELGFSLSVANAYISALTEAGCSIEDVLSQFHFTFSIGSSYFLEIAKLRAARLLFAEMVNAYEIKEENLQKIDIHTVTSSWNKTIYDPYVNILRTTTESMAAVIAGTSSHSIKSFDMCYKKSDDFSERIARNQQIILKEESFFEKVSDPAAGSYYIENLTASVAEEAWKLFIEIEGKNGFIESFMNGSIQKEITKISNQRDLNIATRKEVLLGTNQFANQKEQMDKAITLTSCLNKKQKTENMIAQPLKQYRGAEAFEKLRLTTEKSTKIPKVFLFTIGNLAMRKARAGFASNFFGCAGFSIIDNPGFTSLEEGVKTFLDSKAEICVLCSSDDEYAELVPQLIEMLKDKTTLVLAGYPKNLIDSFKAAGLNHYIFVGCNVLETLQNFQKELGI